MKKIFLYILVAVTIIGSSSLNAYADDTSNCENLVNNQCMDGFYQLNGINYYSPNFNDCSSSQATNVIAGNDNIEKTLGYFVSKGMTLAQAAGIAANISADSSFNPAKTQSGAIATADYQPVAGTGFGLVEWKDSDRQQGLVELATSSKRTVIDLTLQLDYIWQEMNTNLSASLVSVKGATTADAAAFAFNRDYEGSTDTQATVNTTRGAEALTLYAAYQKTISDGTVNTDGGDSPCVSPTASGNFIIYNQNDPKWAKNSYGASTIGAAGCGPSAMAMIITNLTGKTVTPADTAAYGAAHGTLYQNGLGGSLHNVDTVIGSHWGLTSTKLGKDVAKIDAGLQAGGFVIVTGSGASPFTKEGHFIVIRAVTADGNWLVGDSNDGKGTVNSTKEWSPSFIMSEDSSGYVALLTK